jgi:hypothetical protein
MKEMKYRHRGVVSNFGFAGRRTSESSEIRSCLSISVKFSLSSGRKYSCANQPGIFPVNIDAIEIKSFYNGCCTRLSPSCISVNAIGKISLHDQPPMEIINLAKDFSLLIFQVDEVDGIGSLVM